MAAKYSLPPAQIALAWLLGKPGVAAPIIGATKPHHLTDALAATSPVIGEDDIIRLEAPYAPHWIGGYT